MNGTVKPRKMSFPGQYRLGAEQNATVYSIQLFRERLSKKMCTRPSRKVIWDMINTLFLNSKPPTIPFGIVACTFSDNLSRNSCIQLTVLIVIRHCRALMCSGFIKFSLISLLLLSSAISSFFTKKEVHTPASLRHRRN